MATIDYKKANLNTLKKVCKGLNETGLLQENIDMRVGVNKQTLADAFVKGIETCSDIDRLDDVPEAVYDYYVAIVVPTADPGADGAGADGAGADGAGADTGAADAGATTGETTPPAKATGRGAAKATTGKGKKATPAKPKTAAQKKKEKAAADKKAKADKAAKAKADKKAKADAAAKVKADKKAKAAPRITRAACFAGIVTDGKVRTKKQMIEAMQKQYPGSKDDGPFWVNVYCSVLLALGLMDKKDDGTMPYER